MYYLNKGASATGMAAIQIAKHKGAHVIATASKKSEPLLKKLGMNILMGFIIQGFTDYYLIIYIDQQV